MARLPKIPRTPKEKAKWRERRAGGQKPTRRGEFWDRLKRNIFGDDVVDSLIEIKRKTTTRISRTPAIDPISNSTDITLPSIVVPKVERPNTRADVSTLVKQMDSLLRVAQSIGALSLEQQNLIIKQIKQAKAVTKEAQLEAGIGGEPQAEMVQDDEDTASNLRPLNSVMDKLTQTVNDLIDTINEKMKEKCDCQSVGLPSVSGNRGMGSVGLPAPVKPNKARLPSGPQNQPLRGNFKRDPNDRRSTMMRWGQRRKAGGQKPSIAGEFGKRVREQLFGSGYEAERAAIRKVAGTAARPSGFARTAAAATGRASPAGLARTAAGAGAARSSGLLARTAAAAGAVRPAGLAKTAAGAAGLALMAAPSMAATRPAAPASTQVAGMMGSSLKRSSGAPQVVNEQLAKKIAEPIIAKALGNGSLKTIPVTGPGGVIAADKIVEGNIGDAGVSPATGLAGPLAALPALTAALSRDVYSGMYGAPPELDPGFGPKLQAINGIVEELIKNKLAPKIQPQRAGAKGPGGPNMSSVKAKTGGATMPISPPTLTRPPQPSTPTATPTPAPSAPTSPPADRGGGGGGGAPPSPPKPPAAPSPPSVSAAAAQVPAATQSLSDVAVPAAPPKGSEISAASMANEVESRSSVVVTPPVEAPQVSNQPARDITTKSGAKGMGDVPEVNYPSLGDFASKLYFTAMV